ncbi:hypothetical protein [Aurantimicrobium sp.]|uniref:hypothetical protein n=1 Tax=Aurantimicrobium sp. TaxID=1930784 RepID=UPI002FC5AAA0
MSQATWYALLKGEILGATTCELDWLGVEAPEEAELCGELTAPLERTDGRV